MRQRLAAYYASNHFGKRTESYRDPEAHLEKEDAHVGMTSRAIVAGAGKFRVHRMRDGWIDFARFRRTLHYQLYYADAGIVDRIWISVPVHENVESTLLVDRYARPGGEKKLHVARGDSGGRRLPRGGGAPPQAPARDRSAHRRQAAGVAERGVLRGLLSSKSEKEIAVATKQSVHTVHAYVKMLYARFGVQSRQGLMALWLGNTGGMAVKIT